MPTEDDVPTSDIRELLVVETTGADTTSAEAQTMPVMGTPIGQAFLQPTPRRLDRIDLDIDGIDSMGPALVLPPRTTDTVAGVLVALRDNGAQPFSDEQLDMMAAFVDEAALAWQLATSQRRMREVDVLTDRDRIARDLHDHVIQRLFAVGLALQGTVPFNRVQQRLSDSVDDLQGVIQEIRTTIFDLHPRKVPDCGSGSMRRSRSSPAPICAPRVNSPARCRWSMLHWPTTSKLVREAVSNAVRHSGATTLSVTVSVEDDVCIEVVDEGRGISGDNHRKWPDQPAQTRTAAGGAFTFQNPPGAGTLLRWSAPLP